MIVMCPSFGVLRKCKIGLYWLASNSQLKDSGKCIENWGKLNKIFKACKLIEDSCPVQEKKLSCCCTWGMIRSQWL